MYQKNKYEKYSNFISIGFFCSVALEIERIGLRSTSGPFDWLICSAEGVFNLIQNRFDHFLDIDILMQDSKYKNHYYNPRYNVWFYNDFNKYQSLEDQIDSVNEKYQRRITRFYNQIGKQTLFIRYIANYEELLWWNKNLDAFLDMIREYNKENDILFIANEGIDSEKFIIHHVLPDENDNVARKPLEKNENLKRILEFAPYANRRENLKKYYQKKQQKNIWKRKIDGFKQTLKQFLCKEYIHDKIYFKS